MAKQTKKASETNWKKLYQDLKISMSISHDALRQFEIENNLLKKQLEDHAELFSKNLSELSGKTKELVKPDKYNNLVSSLKSCLSHEELGAAEIMGCSPEVYAVELLRIFQTWKKDPRRATEAYQRNFEQR